MMEAKRPKPEELFTRYGLAMRSEARPRGTLKVFLGAAPGVGKTYAMLLEGRRLKAEGRDVIVGFVEPHGRMETIAQIGDLELIPRRVMHYRGRDLEEMDTEAVLARAPDIAIVDELAHTNPRGSAREKRYEDIEVLRAAGINILSAVNIQHLESLTDVVYGITGVQVRETVPDRILDDATEVQFVDLPIQTLIDRLERGHIYPPERARQAREHFFRAGNLTALREVALRRTAAGVNDQLERYMHEHAIDDVWPAAERILALFDHRGSGDAITRQAWRFASALQGDLVVVAIVPPGGVAALPSAQRALIERHLQLAKDLGAETRLVEGTLTAEIAAAQIREENALVVVIGHKPEDRWRRAFRPSVIDDLLKLVDGVSILVVEQN